MDNLVFCNIIQYKFYSWSGFPRLYGVPHLPYPTLHRGYPTVRVRTTVSSVVLKLFIARHTTIEPPFGDTVIYYFSPFYTFTRRFLRLRGLALETGIFSWKLNVNPIKNARIIEPTLVSITRSQFFIFRSLSYCWEYINGHFIFEL